MSHVHQYNFGRIEFGGEDMQFIYLNLACALKNHLYEMSPMVRLALTFTASLLKVPGSILLKFHPLSHRESGLQKKPVPFPGRGGGSLVKTMSVVP